MKIYYELNGGVVPIEETRMTRETLQEKNPTIDRKPRLFWIRVLMIICGLLLFLTFSAKQTVFNVNYVQSQVVKSNAASTINQQVNTQLQQAGIQQTNLIPDNVINDELKSMIGEFYAGEEVKLDQSIIMEEVNANIGTSGMIQQGIVSIIVNQVANIFNSQLDTQKLTHYAGQVAKLQKLNQIMMAISAVGLLILTFFAFIKRRGLNLLGSMMVTVGAFATVISAIAYVSNVLNDLPIQYAVIKGIVEQAGQDILLRELTMALGILILGIILLVLSFGANQVNKKRSKNR
ncbi:hypothetical protein ACIPCB_07940 [Pediococcus pentosaceus]|jgi:hypothetical protein|uniref:hypothetical protein n=1 Tax=Pediococcus pentosaceus TaxID=1255 RepID=UPI000AAD8562|nr:hypothetical protein [Pediococcus pentosaceus]MCQ9316023.1 hypothetical protein [Pediococcus pentosaceus]MCQ9338296.1 hypothetical protein [Pediococcus pentosaceus]MCV3326271.1 hypothetical protein [Pediococcus pentosaceus]MDQ7253254.1 hypothetical protein [Pediococcus pentosaceus]MDY8107056.1 hypothetical protein [Pediococcus pentosaceus]